MFFVNFLILFGMLYMTMFYVLKYEVKRSLLKPTVVVSIIILLVEMIVGTGRIYGILGRLFYDNAYSLLAIMLIIYGLKVFKLKHLGMVVLLNLYLSVIVMLGTLVVFPIVGIDVQNVINYPFYNGLGALIGFILFLIIIVRIKITERRKYGLVSLFVAIVGMFVFLYVTDMYIEFRYTGVSELYMVVMSLLILVAGATQVSLPFIIELRDYHLNKVEQRERILAASVDSHAKYDERVNEIEAEGRKFQHDIKQQLISGLLLLEEGTESDAFKHFSSLVGNVNVLESTYRYRTGLKIIDGNLYNLLKKVDYDEVEFEIIGLIPRNLILSTSEITSLFMNLLSNAFEGAVRCKEEKKVRLVMKSDVDFFYIGVENTFFGEVRMSSQGVFETTKINGTNHGFGTIIINDIVNKYDGGIEWKAEKGMFSVDISFDRDIYENNANQRSFAKMGKSFTEV